MEKLPESFRKRAEVGSVRPEARLRSILELQAPSNTAAVAVLLSGHQGPVLEMLA